MQRSLLTRPSQPEDLQVAVRYQPAAEQLQVGGDWYDSFIGPDGSTTLVVGDVTGHDQWAAAAMAQVRNLLRGVAYTLSQSPARELAVLDAAMYGLGVGVYATALLARVDRDPDDLEGTTRRLRWSNAGHPPPVLLGRDGRARLLETPPDVLLGLGDAPRHDHVVALAPGDTVVLYTDGLVERRDSPIDARLKWLTDLLQGGQDADPEALCDRLLDAIDANVDDDVALLVLRVSERPADTVAPSEPAPGLDTAAVDS
jgi:serine phosphatase RsbU (regulator of sigma subunit)